MTGLLDVLGGGVLAQVLLFVLLHRLIGLTGRAAALGVALLTLLIYVPWAILTWPGVDVFAIHLAIFLTVTYALGLVGGRVGRGWHWAPAVIVGFFVVVVATNVVFLGVAERGMTGLFARLLPEPQSSDVANSRFPGTVSHDYQEKEALYNEYLRQVQAQQARGWTVRKGWRQAPIVGQPATFIVAVSDRHDAPVSGADVDGTFLRTSDSREDLEFVMHEVAPGEYRVDLSLPLPGRWDLVLRIRQRDDLHEVRASTSVASAGTGDDA